MYEIYLVFKNWTIYWEVKTLIQAKYLEPQIMNSNLIPLLYYCGKNASDPITFSGSKTSILALWDGTL